MCGMMVVGLLLASALPAWGQERVRGERPRIQPAPQAKPQRGVQPETPSKFEQLRLQALANRSPGGRPDAESSALLQELKSRYVSRVEEENTRVRDLARTVGPPRPGPGQQGPPGPGAIQELDPELQACAQSETIEVESIEMTPPLDPGEWVVLKGCGLGYPAGELRLVGDFPGGHAKLQINGWWSTGVSAQLPLVTGVGDMPAAKLQVVRQDNKISGWVDVGGFRATREVKLIHPNDVVVTCGSPWQGDNAECTLAKSHPLSESQFFGGATFASKHAQETAPKDSEESALACLGFGKEHSDLASVNLANGWTLAGYAWWWNPLAGTSYVLSPAGFNAGSSSATIAMSWGTSVNACHGPYKSQVRYRVDLYAVGPKDVPYK